MGKVTISTVLGYKEYVVENIKNIRGEDEENSDFKIYPDYHKIYRGQTEIVLTKAEYELFMLLSGRPGVIFTKEKIFEILYNEELPESIDNIVYCLVSSMRKKIEPELKQCRYIKSVTDVRIILECLQEAYQMEGDMVRSGKNIHATMIYPFVRMLQEKCRDLTEEQIHKTLWKEYEISGADRMFVERASKILEPYEGESEDEK